jgi:calcineurin-like phosphoesterase family protein
MTLFFTSDTHFGHENIIRKCARPFSSAAEMDEAMIARWNDTVAPGDIVYHLGDFWFRSSVKAGAYLDRLQGTIHLVSGNHDAETVPRFATRFASVSLIAEVRVEGRLVVLCHYPMREWNGAWQGAWHLFGHVHGRLNHAPNGYSLDVGVDSHDFRPWCVEEIARVFETRENPFQDGARSYRAVQP